MQALTLIHCSHYKLGTPDKIHPEAKPEMFQHIFSFDLLAQGLQRCFEVIAQN